MFRFSCQFQQPIFANSDLYFYLACKIYQKHFKHGVDGVFVIVNVRLFYMRLVRKNNRNCCIVIYRDGSCVGGGRRGEE